MLQSPPMDASFESGTLEPVPLREHVVELVRREAGSSPNGRAEPRQRELAQRLSLKVAYELWLGSWEAALAALAKASQNRTLSTNEAAAHKAVIAAERELVTKEFTLLIGADVLGNSRTTNSEVHGP